MSALGAIFLGDTIIFATDTVCCDPTITIDKNGKELKEVLSRFSSKSIYYPHLETSVSVLGTSLLSNEYHKFIENDHNTGSVSDLDELLCATEKYFVKFIDRPEIKAFENALEKDPKSDFLGTVFLIGLSHVNDVGEKREKSMMQAFKLMVYKNQIKKKLMNPVYDKLMYCMHPILPGEIIDKIFNEHEKNPTSYDNVIIDFFKEAKAIYDNSDREEPLTGGQVNFTAMSYNEGRLNTSHYTGYRFDDFEEITDEIKSYNKQRKLEDELLEIFAKNERILKAKEVKDRLDALEARSPEFKDAWSDLVGVFNDR